MPTKKQFESWLEQIDKHLEAAETGIRDGKYDQAEADVFQAHKSVRHIQAIVAKLPD